jgi:DtxR family Mn-dependent transcriptional regulator
VSLTTVAGELKPEESRTVVIARLGEPLQTDIELLARLSEGGVRPESELILTSPEAGISSVARAGADIVLDLPEEVARHVFVKA